MKYQEACDWLNKNAPDFVIEVLNDPLEKYK
jgi:hypothetical protein